jgi:alpha-ketoglutarate-dependent 2,4-dichlorophenoxyacetate dioxygenase
MAITFKKLHPTFMAEVSPLDLREVRDEVTLGQLRQGMTDYGVLVFKGQQFSHQDQLEFAQRFDGELHSKTSNSALSKNRFGNDALTDISNVTGDGDIMAANDRRRMNNISNRVWHTDASFVDPAGRYSMLFARNIPPVRADTEFADMRAAYDALDAQTKETIANLHVHHSIVYSRHTMGFDFAEEEKAKLPGATQPLVKTIAGSHRKGLYLASHADYIVEWPVPEGRLLLKDLTEHATQPQFVHHHEWTLGDFVIWDNRTTMHRGRPFDDTVHKRELTRVTTLDIALS